MKFSINFFLCIFLSINIISSVITPNTLQANNITALMDGGFVDIMQVKNNTGTFTINGYDCGITQITVVNNKGIQMIPTYHTTDYSFSLTIDTNTWPSGTYTIIVQAENNCSTTKQITI